MDEAPREVEEVQVSTSIDETPVPTIESVQVTEKEEITAAGQSIVDEEVKEKTAVV